MKNFIDTFHIPKGDDDIRMVLNGTSCGLTMVVFAPNEWLPYSPIITRLLHFGYKLVDLDIGECFLNLNLHKELIPYLAIDLSYFRKELEGDFLESKPFLKNKRIAATFNRMWFGYRQLPEVCAMYYELTEEVARGDPVDLDNTLCYNIITINAISTVKYNPALPNVYKWDNVAKIISGDIVAYVDYLMTIGHSWEAAWKIAYQVASRLQIVKEG